MGSVLAFLLPQSKAVEQELLKSVTRDERPCWALPAHPQLAQQKHSKSGISSLDGGYAAAVLSLQWEGQGQWLNSPQVIQIILFGKNLLAVTQIELYLARVYHLLNPPTTEQ